jgi:DNA-binding LacI/PurR family transcriptional regulator
MTSCDLPLIRKMKDFRESHPTIYDVAALSGVSISTVSRVLNSPERVSNDARQKVITAIDELGFVPKAEARARALQNSPRIGVLTPFFTAPSFVQRLRGIGSALTQTNHELIIYTVDSLPRLQGYLTNLPIKGNLEGLIVMSLPVDGPSTQRLEEHGPLTVFIEYRKHGFSSIEIDDYQGGILAAEYLVSKGHRRCAFIGDIDPPDFAIRPVVQRLEGFRQGLHEAGLTLATEYVRSAPYGQAQTQKAVFELLHLPLPPTAIFAAADIQATITLKVARELGLDVPGDLAVLGFDDLDLAEYIGLTTIRQSLDDSGRIAVELLLSKLSDPDHPSQHIQLPLSIVERDTV